MKLKKGDQVLVLSGKHAGKKGKILRIAGEDRVVVEGVNLVKRHQRATQKFQGGIVEKPAALNVSKVALICPRCSQPSRVGRREFEEGKRVRFCRRCKEIVDKV